MRKMSVEYQTALTISPLIQIQSFPALTMVKSRGTEAKNIEKNRRERGDSKDKDKNHF